MENENCDCSSGCKCKCWLHILIGLLIIAGAAYGGYYYANNQDEEVEEEIVPEEEIIEEEEVAEEEVKTGSETVSIDDTWNLYTNYDLGFSMEIPKESTQYTDNNQYAAYQMQILEDTANNTVYFTSNPDATLASLQSEDYTPWKIEITEVTSEAELIAFGAARWSETCTKVEIEDTSHSGTYDATLKGESEENEYGFPDCFINGITFLKYSPEKNLAATWGVGQDSVMYLKEGDDFTPYDLAIAETFQFL